MRFFKFVWRQPRVKEKETIENKFKYIKKKKRRSWLRCVRQVSMEVLLLSLCLAIFSQCLFYFLLYSTILTNSHQEPIRYQHILETVEYTSRKHMPLESYSFYSMQSMRTNISFNNNDWDYIYIFFLKIILYLYFFFEIISIYIF
jgi:hypothetical protein